MSGKRLIWQHYVEERGIENEVGKKRGKEVNTNVERRDEDKDRG